VVPEAGVGAQSGSATPFAYSVASRSEQVPLRAWVSSSVVVTLTVESAAAGAAPMAAGAIVTAAAASKVIRRLADPICERKTRSRR
jgi:hypothetical protein